MTFDPLGWLTPFVAEERLHRLIRLAMALVLVGFLVLRISEYHRYALKPLWFVETLLFVVLLMAVLGRVVPVDRSRGVRDIVVPLVGAVLPFALLLSPPSPAVLANRVIFFGALWEMTAATTLTVAGLWSLRRSFSITVEARSLVTAGPYRFVRHPVYLGEILAAAGVTIIRFSPANALILILFVAVQLFRARREEEKLSRTFPAYRAFAAQSRWFW
ncbi:MAG TPA: methyltransferase [Geobacteraceae bacterium]